MRRSVFTSGDWQPEEWMWHPAPNQTDGLPSSARVRPFPGLQVCHNFNITCPKRLLYGSPQSLPKKLWERADLAVFKSLWLTQPTEPMLCVSRAGWGLRDHLQRGGNRPGGHRVHCGLERLVGLCPWHSVTRGKPRDSPAVWYTADGNRPPL